MFLFHNDGIIYKVNHMFFCRLTLKHVSPYNFLHTQTSKSMSTAEHFTPQFHMIYIDL